MSYFLFVDESGHDRKLSPAEVLGGFAIRDGALWPFIQAVFELQKELFGITYPDLNAERRATGPKGVVEDIQFKEIKGDNFLNRRVFKQATLCPPFSLEERRTLANFALRSGPKAERRSISALAQAKLAYVQAMPEVSRPMHWHRSSVRCAGRSEG